MVHAFADDLSDEIRVREVEVVSAPFDRVDDRIGEPGPDGVDGAIVGTDGIPGAMHEGDRGLDPIEVVLQGAVLFGEGEQFAVGPFPWLGDEGADGPIAPVGDEVQLVR